MLKPYVILLLMMISACTPRSEQVNTTLLQGDSLIEQHPDSALHLLQGIDYRSLNEEQQAHYGLLLTAARYKLYQPVDTTFINHSIDYYAASHQKGKKAVFHRDDKRGASLYYKAVVLYELGKKEEATLLLKQAEELVEQGSDELLKNKIYQNLDRVNDEADNHLLGLKYARKFLNSSIILKDAELTAMAYDHMAHFYLHLNMIDSANHTRKLALSKLDQVSNECKSYILANLANSYINAKRYNDAFDMLQQAIHYHPNGNQYIMLGKLYNEKGDTKNAQLSWEKAIGFGGMNAVKAYRLLSSLYEKQGNQAQALALSHVSDSLEQDINSKTKTSELSEMQHQYDLQVNQKRWSKSMWKWVALLVSIIVIVITVYSLYAKRLGAIIKRKEDQRAIDKNTIEKLEEYNEAHLWRYEQLQNEYRAQVEQLENQIQQDKAVFKQLEDSIGKHKHEIVESQKLRMKIEELEKNIEIRRNRQGRLQQTIEELRSGTSQNVEMGIRIYDLVMSNKPVNVKNKEWKTFIDCYEIRHPDELREELNKYEALPTLLKVHLILTMMGKTEEQMASILSVGTTAIRVQKTRLKARKKQ